MALTELDKVCAMELKSLRKNNKLTQGKMAEFLALDSQQQYSDLENGKKHFTDSIVLKICNMFNISILNFISSSTYDSNLSLFLSDEDYNTIEHATDNEIKLILYRKLLIESKIENAELKLSLLHKDFDFKNITQNKIHVII